MQRLTISASLSLVLFLISAFPGLATGAPGNKSTVATLGTSGRSTGPHLHYVVEVDGKTRNPLDYIFE